MQSQGAGDSQIIDSAEIDGATEEMEYVPPAPASTIPAGAVFYKLDGSKITLTEAAMELFWPLAVLAWVLMKFVGKSVPCSSDDPCVASLEPFKIAEDRVPVAIREDFRGMTEQLGALGFAGPVWHVIDDHLHSTKTVMATFPHRVSPAAARIHRRVWSVKTPPKIKQYVEFITAFDDGSFLWSSNGKPDMIAPKACRIHRRVGATTADLWKSHQDALANDPSGRARARATTRDDAVRIANRLHETVTNFHIDRGVFRAVSAADESQRAVVTGAHAQAAAVGSRYPEVLAEIEKIQQGKVGWPGMIMLLVVALVVLLLLGFQGISLARVSTLAGILTLHEMGRFVAMKACGYRNVRMFFLPGLGALVQGQSFNVPGWKKGVAALMGPVPGIIAGVFIGLCGMWWSSDFAKDAAWMLLIVNGFDLLPVLPFAGGHVLQTVLFSRHYVLNILFRAIAAGFMLLLAIGAPGLVGVVVVMVMGIATEVRVMKAVEKLKREGMSAASPDSQTIPPETAERIVSALQEGATKPQHAKLVAQQAVQVFDTLNTRPPGALGSMALLGVHGFSFLLALVFGIVFAWSANSATMSSFMHSAQNRPAHLLAAKAPAIESSARPAGWYEAEHGRVVATFPNAKRADAAYSAVAAKLGPGERAEQFGATVFVSFPASDDEGRKKWLGEMQKKSKDAFVESDKMAAYFRFQALARTIPDAEKMQKELDQYFGLPVREGLIAPWSTIGKVTPEQELARATFEKLLKTQSVWDAPEMRALQDRQKEARRGGDKEGLKKLSAEEKELIRTLQRKKIELVLAEPADRVDRETAQKYMEVWEKNEPKDFWKASQTACAARMGRAGPGSMDGAEDDLTYATGGGVSRATIILEFYGVRFKEPATGARALVEWLESKGCKDIRYEVIGMDDYEFWDEDEMGVD